MDLPSKIAALLRIYTRHPDTPEGLTAKALADKLMAQHSLDVELDGEGDPSCGPPRVAVATYPMWEGWRNRVAELVRYLYDVSSDWRNTEDTVSLWIFDPLSEENESEAGRAYLEIEEMILGFELPIAILPPVSDDEMSRIIATFRRGIVDAIVPILQRRNRYGAFRVGDAPPPASTTAMVRVRYYNLPKDVVPDAPINGAPPLRDERDDMRSSMFLREIYRKGVEVGREASGETKRPRPSPRGFLR